MCIFAYVVFGLKGTCLPVQSGVVVRSEYKHRVCSRWEILCSSFIGSHCLLRLCKVLTADIGNPVTW